MRLGRILLDPQGGEGNGGGTGTAADENKGQAADKGVDLVKAVEGLVARHGDPTAALRVLMGENYSLRDRNRDLGAKVPGADAVVLTGDDAKHWSSYRQLGAPGDLKKALDAGRQFEAEAGSLRKAEADGRAAEVTTIDGCKLRPSVLRTLARDLEIVVAEEKGKDGKAVPVARVKGEGDESIPLAEYAAKHWAEFLPSLKADPPARPLGTPTVPRPAAPASGATQAAGPRQSYF